MKFHEISWKGEKLGQWNFHEISTTFHEISFEKFHVYNPNDGAIASIQTVKQILHSSEKTIGRGWLFFFAFGFNF